MAKQGTQEQRRQLDLVNEVAATVEIFDVKFASFSARYDLVSGNGPMTAQFKYRASARAEGSEEPKIIVLADFVMEARPESSEAGEPCCEIRAQMVLTYKSPKATDFSAEHLEAFAQTNGIYNAWPYWRELVQSCTARMGLPALIVPSLRPRIISRKKQETTNQATTAAGNSAADK